MYIQTTFILQEYHYKRIICRYEPKLRFKCQETFVKLLLSTPLQQFLKRTLARTIYSLYKYFSMFIFCEHVKCILCMCVHIVGRKKLNKKPGKIRYFIPFLQHNTAPEHYFSSINIEISLLSSTSYFLFDSYGYHDHEHGRVVFYRGNWFLVIETILKLCRCFHS